MKTIRSLVNQGKSSDNQVYNPEELLADLYAGNSKMIIIVDDANKRTMPLDVSLRGSDGAPDCCIGHFGYNFYMRTPYGLSRKKYTTVDGLRKACERVLADNGLTPKAVKIQSKNAIYFLDY